MRPLGSFYYILTYENTFTEVTSGVKIKEGDELNWKGNKLFVKHAEGSLLTVEKIGSAIIVK